MLVSIETYNFHSWLILTENFLVRIKTQNFSSCLILTENLLGNIKTQNCLSCFHLNWKVRQSYNHMPEQKKEYHLSCFNPNWKLRQSYKSYAGAKKRNVIYHVFILTENLGSLTIICQSNKRNNIYHVFILTENLLGNIKTQNCLSCFHPNWKIRQSYNHMPNNKERFLVWIISKSK